MTITSMGGMPSLASPCSCDAIALNRECGHAVLRESMPPYFQMSPSTDCRRLNTTQSGIIGGAAEGIMESSRPQFGRLLSGGVRAIKYCDDEPMLNISVVDHHSGIVLRARCC